MLVYSRKHKLAFQLEEGKHFVFDKDNVPGTDEDVENLLDLASSCSKLDLRVFPIEDAFEGLMDALTKKSK